MQPTDISEHEAHPTPDQLYDYVSGEVRSAETRANVDTHLAKCSMCAATVDTLRRCALAVDEWTPEHHGSKYWRAQLPDALARATQAATPAVPYLKELLAEPGGVVAHIAVSLAKTAALTPRSAFSAAYSLAFSSAHLGPDMPDSAAMAQAQGPEGSAVSVLADAETRRLVVRLDQGKTTRLVIRPVLVSHSDPSQVIPAETVQLTDAGVTIFVFSDLPRGKLSLFLTGTSPEPRH